MLSHNAFLINKLGQARQRELLEEAETERLARRIKPDRLRLRDRFFLNAGDLLISFGLRLKERWEAVWHKKRCEEGIGRCDPIILRYQDCV